MRGRRRFSGRRLGERAPVAEHLEKRVLLASVAAFLPQVTITAGTQPRGVTIADVNGDARPDLIVANGGSGSVGVMLGNGNGTFGAHTTFAAGSGPFSVTAADLNRDGKIDLVVSNNGAGNVSVLLGNGNGTFTSQQTQAAGTQARFVAVGDLNGDGKPDLAVANYGVATVSVMLGNGDGTFSAQQTFSAGTQPSSIAVGDFNHDGRLDLAVANKSPGTLSVLLGNGNGTFGARATYGAGSLPFSVVAGDVNGDGRSDLMVAEEQNGVAGVLLGNANGTFGGQTTFAVGATPASVVVGDINGDGKLDIATANYNSGTVSVLLGNANGTFGAQKTFGVGTQPFSIAAGDVNRDGRVDLAVANFEAGSVGVLVDDPPPVVVSINRVNPIGPITGASSVTFGVTFSKPVTGVDFQDFVVVLSRDATFTAPVVVSGSGASYQVTVNGISGTGPLGLNLVDNGSIVDSSGRGLANAIPANFATQQTFATVPAPLGMTLADVNGDGVLDAVLANSSRSPGVGQAVGVMLGNGDGTFKATQTFATDANPQSLVVGDVNGDGVPDIVTANAQAGDVSVLLGNGNGTFGAQATFAAGAYPGGLVAGDVNGDGRVDLVLLNQAGGMSVLLGNGNGTFAPRVTFATGANSPVVVALGDMNGDGKVDAVVVHHSNPGTVSTLLGNGNGSFAAPLTQLTSMNNTGVALADLNRDGRMDVVASNGAGVSVLTGNGDGTLSLQKTYAAGDGAAAVKVGDVNGDAIPDVIVAAANSSYVALLAGNGDGTLREQQTLGTSGGPMTVALGDLNGDGRLDVVSGNWNADNMGVFLQSGLGSATGPAYALHTPQTLVVTNTADDGSAGSLRNILGSASDGDTVTFDPTVFAPGVQHTITLNGTQLEIAHNVTIQGPGAGVVTVNGNNLSRVFQVDIHNSVTISGITISGGNSSEGGGLLSDGTTVLNNVTFTGSTSVTDGGAIKNDGSLVATNCTFTQNQTGGLGGVLYAIGATTVLTNDIFDLNSSQQGGALYLGIAGSTTISGSTFSNGTAVRGGAVVNASALSVVNSTFSANTASTGVGGAIANDGAALTVTNCTIAANSAVGGGGGIYLQGGAATLNNTIVATNTVGASNTPGDLAGLAFAGAFNLIGDGSGGLSAASGNLLGTAVAPLNAGLVFLNDNGGPTRTMALMKASPAYGAGSNALAVDSTGAALTTDQRGRPRISGSVVDIGAYEAQPPTGPTALVAVGGGGGISLSWTASPDGATYEVYRGTTSGGETGPNYVNITGTAIMDTGVTPGVTYFYQVKAVNAAGTSPAGNEASAAAVALQPVINGTSGSDAIALVMDADALHIDWTMGSASGQMLIGSPNGLTINGNGGNDVITLDYSHGNPLPNVLHLNGTFTVNGLAGVNPFAGTSIEIARSTVYFSYAGTSPAAVIRAALAAGYNGGAWNGTSSNGAITSTAAKNNANHNTAIGWADSADGSGVNPTPNTVELKYTLVGDVNLDGAVNITDVNALVPHYNSTGNWTGGDFNYDGQVNITDVNALVPNYNTSLGNQVVPSASAAPAATAQSPVTAEAVNAATVGSTRIHGVEITDSVVRRHKPRRVERE